MKVLVAEDDAVSSRLLDAALRKLGYDVVLAADGRDAWYSFLAENPRVVITDWMMPVMSGPELCRKIRGDRRTQYTYIILLTALGGKDSHMEGMAAGADDFVSKPLDLDGLSVRLRVAERVLALQRQVSQLAGLLPICSYCRRIRDDQNEWQGLEGYVAIRTEASFAQTLCPECDAAAGGGDHAEHWTARNGLP